MQHYINLLLKYWEQEPTTMGHGFSHVIKVAVESYEIAKLNNYPNAEYLFVAGLVHDMSRPAEGSDGEEDQSKTAKVARELLEKTDMPSNYIDLIYNACISHDNWRGQKDVPVFHIILSIADKACLTPAMIYQYAWASNKYLQNENKSPAYTNHLRLLYGFYKYQIRAWEIFMKHPINGVERGIETYLNVVRNTSNNYLEDKNGDTFFEYLETQAELARTEELEYLQAFKENNVSVEKIMRLFY